MLRSLPLPKFLPRKPEERRAEIYRAFVRQEAKIGGGLFGPIPAGHRREFFSLDRSTWIWYEEWVDAKGQRQVVTTRYSIRPNAILKSQGNNTYEPISREELRNFYKAVKLYGERVDGMYQQFLQTA